MYCPRCGTPLPEGALYCGGCGEAIAVSEPSVAQAIAASTKRRRSKAILSATIGLALVAIAAALYVAFLKPYDISEKNFPDRDLRAALAEQCDADGDGRLSRDEASAVTSLNLSGKPVESLSGLRLLPNLSKLDISRCAFLQEVEWDEVANLTVLEASGSGIQSLEAAALPNLERLDARNSGLLQVDFSNNTALDSLELDDSVRVKGLEETKLEARYQLMRYDQVGFTGTFDGPGQSASEGEGEVLFQYDDSYNQISRVVNVGWDSYTTTYTHSEKGVLYGYEIATQYAATPSKCMCVYDDDGRFTEIIATRGQVIGTVLTQTYDADGRLIRTDLWREESNYLSYEYEYENGKLAEIRVIYSADNVVSWALARDFGGNVVAVESEGYKATFTYDSQGFCSGKTMVRTKGYEMPLGTWNVTFERDADGNVTAARREYLGIDGDLVSTTDVECILDPYGNEIARSVTGSRSSDWSSTGNVSLEYERYFVEKGTKGPDSGLLAGDPTSSLTLQGAIQVDILKDESPEVKQFLLQSTALYSGFCY